MTPECPQSYPNVIQTKLERGPYFSPQGGCKPFSALRVVFVSPEVKLNSKNRKAYDDLLSNAALKDELDEIVETDKAENAVRLAEGAGEEGGAAPGPSTSASASSSGPSTGTDTVRDLDKTYNTRSSGKFQLSCTMLLLVRIPRGIWCLSCCCIVWRVASEHRCHSKCSHNP
jgi:hypothetical protein